MTSETVTPSPGKIRGASAGQKVVLAFGDSLAWGTNPLDGHRHHFENRWTTVLANVLAGSAHVVVEGQRGRTSIFDDPTGEVDRNGVLILPVLLASHYPLDLVVIMLGSNDLKQHISGRAEAVAAGINKLVGVIQDFVFLSAAPRPQVLLVAPPQFRLRSDGTMPAGNRQLGGEGARLPRMLEEVAKARGCFFTDSAFACEASAIDGVHLDAEGNARLGQHLGSVVSRILWPAGAQSASQDGQRLPSSATPLPSVATP